MALVNQTLKLEITPVVVPPKLHVTEYDENMQIVVQLFQRGQYYEIPSGTTAKVEGSFSGRYPFSADATVDGSNVIFELTKGMTAYAGRAWTKVVLTKDSKPVSTCGFWIDCDRAGVEAETVIGAPGFQEQINQAVAEYIEDSGLIIDSTLSRQGAAADAKATGDAINTLREDVLDSEEISIEVPYYTDQIAISKAAASDDAAVVGLKSGFTLNSSGAEVAASGSYVSGFIPVQMGDVIRVKQKDRSAFDETAMIALYASGESSHSGTGKTVTNIKANAAYGACTFSGNEMTWDTSSISYYTWTHMDVAYLRISATSADMVLTVNEEIRSGSQTIVTSQPILAAAVKVKEDNLDFQIDTNAKHLKGKKILCIGDSLFGLYHGSDSTPAFVAERTGATVYNGGFGGCRMSVHPSAGYAAFSMCKLADAIATGTWTQQNNEAASGQDYFAAHLATLKSISYSTLDFMVIHYGTNDFGAGVALDNASSPKSTSTLCGALRYSIERILAAYPNIFIFVSLPIYRMWDSVGAETYTNSQSKTLYEYAEAMSEVAQNYGCPVIDGLHELGYNAVNFPSVASDKTHLSAVSARKRFGYLIGGELDSKG